MLIPSVAKTGIDDDMRDGRHPRMDYYALRDELVSNGCEVVLIDYTTTPSWLRAGRDFALAFKGAQLAKDFDAIFCNSESIALPLGILLKGRRRRPRVVGIGHRISTPKKRAFFTIWNAMNGIDILFLYSSLQQSLGKQLLGIGASKLKLIQFHADERFFKPNETGNQPQASEGYKYNVCSVGLEWRDYPTLIQAAKQLPEVHFDIVAASPWSKHADETSKVDVPSNVTVKKYGYFDLRDLYRRSHLCVTPLYENDFQAGITTILEAMACGLPLIATKTSGQTDAIVEGENGLYVPPGDSEILFDKIQAVLNNSVLRERLGPDARKWIENKATLDIWTKAIGSAILNKQIDS